MTVQRPDQVSEPGWRGGPGGEEATLPISGAAQRTGIPPDTLRVWQRRYGLGPSRLSSGGHRRYTGDDLDRLRAVQQLIGRGVSAGEAARTVLRVDSRDLPLPEDASVLVHRLSAAALRLDGPAVRSLLTDHVSHSGPESAWETLARPVLRAIGERWSGLSHGIAVEHVLSRMCAIVFEEHRATAVPDAPVVLLTCVPGEEHDLPLTALGAALAERGIAAVAGGRLTGPDELAAAIAGHRARVTVVYAHQRRRSGIPIVPAWERPECPLVAAGPGWERDRLPDGTPYTNDLGHALRTVSGLL